MGSKYLAYAVQFASLMVLARLFSPEIFGVVAAVQVFYTFFQLVAEGGLGPAIIGLHHLEPRDRDGIFGLTLLLGLILGALFLALMPVLTGFYNMPELSVAVPYIALGLTFNAWGILPSALLQRQQSFLPLAVSAVVAELIALIVVLLAKQALAPLHALSLRLPVVALVNLILMYYFSGRTDFRRPQPGFHFTAIRSLLRVSGYQLAFNMLNFFSRNLDNILVGRYLGASLLGIYDRSYQLMRYPLQLLTFAMTPAIQPVLRSHSNDPVYVRGLHRDLTFKLSLLGVICAAIIYFFARPIILVAFGNQWLSAVPIIKLLALTIPVQVVLSTSGSFFQTFNRTDLLFLCGIFTTVANVMAITWGVWQGTLEHLCWAILVSFHLNFFIVYYILHKHVFLDGYGEFLVKMLPAATALAALIVWHISDLR